MQSNNKALWVGLLILVEECCRQLWKATIYRSYKIAHKLHNKFNSSCPKSPLVQGHNWRKFVGNVGNLYSVNICKDSVCLSRASVQFPLLEPLARNCETVINLVIFRKTFFVEEERGMAFFSEKLITNEAYHGLM